MTADKELATARPKSLWQCTEKIALSELGMRLIKFAMVAPNC